MIEFVFLDMDDTILDFHKAEAVALAKTLRAFGVEPTEEVVQRYSEINALQWQRLERGELTRAQVKLYRFRYLFEELGVSVDAESVRVMYEEVLSHGHYYMEGAEALLSELHGKYKLYIASNGTTAVQKGRIESAGFAPLFDGIFLSEEIGYVKPQKEFFDACFATIPEFDPSRAIILGDSLTSDVQGGNNAGILSCWFNPKGKENRTDVVPSFEVRTLDAFSQLLTTL
ncbi:MAG: YjjG family noncanonical pyrimidine nucleotidase [Clostridia bacterium]|nr:YjjG family noncanonical pyrimidine nucleotidase [Clostridia bacterium]